MPENSNFRSHNDSERFGRIENDIGWLKDIVGPFADDMTEVKISIANTASAAVTSAETAKLAAQTASAIAKDVAVIKEALAAREGSNTMLKYIGHIATIVAGAVAGFLGAGVKHL